MVMRGPITSVQFMTFKLSSVARIWQHLPGESGRIRHLKLVEKVVLNVDTVETDLVHKVVNIPEPEVNPN